MLVRHDTGEPRMRTGVAMPVKMRRLDARIEHPQYLGLPLPPDIRQTHLPERNAFQTRDHWIEAPVGPDERLDVPGTGDRVVLVPEQVDADAQSRGLTRQPHVQVEFATIEVLVTMPER